MNLRSSELGNSGSSEKKQGMRRVYDHAMKQIAEKKKSGERLDDQEKNALKAQTKRQYKEFAAQARQDADAAVVDRVKSKLGEQKKTQRKKRRKEAHKKVYSDARRSESHKKLYAEAKKENDIKEERQAKREERRAKAHNALYTEARRSEAYSKVFQEAMNNTDIDLEEDKKQDALSAFIESSKAEGFSTTEENIAQLKKGVDQTVEDMEAVPSKELSEPEKIQSSIEDVLSEFERRVGADLRKAQKNDQPVTKKMRYESKKQHAGQIIDALKKVEQKLMNQLDHFSETDEVIDEERDLETLAERLYLEIDKAERIAEGEDLALTDAREFSLENMLLSSADEFVPEVPAFFYEEDPAIIEAQKREQKKAEAEITQVIEQAATKEDAHEMVKTAEQSVDIDEEMLNKATQRISGVELPFQQQETMKQYGFSWMLENPEVISVEKQKLDLTPDAWMKENSLQLKRMRNELFSMYGVNPNESVFGADKNVAPEKWSVGYVDRLMSRVETAQAILMRTKAEVTRLLAFKKDVSESGLLPTPQMKSELNDAVELLFEKRLFYNKSTAELNHTAASMYYAKDTRRGMEYFVRNAQDAVDNTSSIYRTAHSIHESLKPLYLSGVASGNEDTLARARRYFDYAEKRVSDLVEVQSNSPFGEGSAFHAQLTKRHADIASMKADLAYFELDNSVFRQMSQSEIGDVLSVQLGEYLSPEEAEQISRAVFAEAGEKYKNKTDLKELNSEYQNLAQEYRDGIQQVKEWAKLIKESEYALERMGYDRITSEGDWLNRNVFSLYNNWNLRRTINTGRAEAGDVAILEQLNRASENVLSTGTLEQIKEGNVSQNNMNELLQAGDRLREFIVQKEIDLQDLLNRTFAIKTQRDLVQQNVEAGI